MTDATLSQTDNNYDCYYISNSGREYFWTGRPSNLYSRFPEAQIICTGVEAVMREQNKRAVGV